TVRPLWERQSGRHAARVRRRDVRLLHRAFPHGPAGLPLRGSAGHWWRSNRRHVHRLATRGRWRGTAPAMGVPIAAGPDSVPATGTARSASGTARMDIVPSGDAATEPRT